ncbi:MAG: hypothetical protein QM713_16430 [Arachnia sp.]
MTVDELIALLNRLIAGWENEAVEFKEANDNFPMSREGEHLRALSDAKRDEIRRRRLDFDWTCVVVPQTEQRHHDPKQQRAKVTNLLTRMRTEGTIRNAGSRQRPRWERV